MIQETDENNCDYRVNIIPVFIREKDHLFEKIFTFLKETITFSIMKWYTYYLVKDMLFISYKKKQIDKYQSIINFMKVIHFSYENRAINQTSKARYI